MATMKAARFTAKGSKLEVADVPIPEPAKGQVRVKVHACGVCHSDMFTQVGAMGNPFPRIPGHEAAGVVEKLGEGVTSFKVGDRVGLGWYGGSCGACHNCQNNQPVHCVKGRVSGISFDGGYAQYTVCDYNTLARIPDELSFEEAGPLMCAGITTFNAIRNQGVIPGSLVAILGVGGLGHLAVQYASKMGFVVAALSTGDDKEKMAKELGAKYYFNTSKLNASEELQKLGGAALIVATAPSAAAISPLVKGLKVGGKLLIVAAPNDNVSINAMDLIQSNGSVSGWASGDNRDSEDALTFSANTGVRAKIEVFPLEKAQDAYDAMLSNKVRFRSVIKMP